MALSKLSIPSPTYKKLTPNLLVADVERSLAFYVDVLGFSRGLTVPESTPFAFASVVSGGVEIFFNEKNSAVDEYPIFAGKPLGASGTMFIEMDDVEQLHEQLRLRAQIILPLVTQWYGLKEFAIVDPDGYVITFAERVAADPASA